VSPRAWAAGFNVVRMNMRNCGGTDALTPTLYHSGLSGDVGAVIRHFADKFGLERVALVGYSMGGNLVMKLAGRMGRAAAACRSGRGLSGSRSCAGLRRAARAWKSSL
jgi:predicted alpha/beta-fold hydrolase